ncbi:hypothetical protein LCM20_18280 [Halobacillus litoralis]|uniref:hypothetical protein n=1 Tax=Halobacillus litoralis TaxID=45668 RepID=UPI001CD27F54|nr:hypothetical protein [Halobacillus litoralis]MCA0972549.1 hypothetical protein [Halobacillus litoralis]
MTKQKWGIIALVLFVFAVGAYITTSGTGSSKLTSEEKAERKAKPVDMDQLPIDWEEVESKEALNDFYTGRIPQLELAREKGATTSPEEMMTVEGKDGRIQINEVWHRGHQVIYLVSIDLSLLTEEDEEDAFYSQPPRIDKLDISETEEVPAQQLHGFSQLDTSEAVIFENRLHGILRSRPLSENPTDNQEVMPEIEPIDAEAMTSIKLNLSDEIIHTDPVTVHYLYDTEQQTIFSDSFSGSYSEDGVTFEPLEFVMRLSGNYMTMRIQDEDQVFNQTLSGTLTIDGQDTSLSPYLQGTDKENVYKIHFGGPLEEVPENVSFTIDRVDFIEETPLSFKLKSKEWEEAQAKGEPFNRTVAEKYQTELIIQRLNYDVDHGMDFMVKYRPESNQQETTVVAPNRLPTNGDPSAQRSSVRITNNNGETGYADVYGNMDESHININPELFEEADSLTVTFEEIVVSSKIDETFDLTIEK